MSNDNKAGKPKNDATPKTDEKQATANDFEAEKAPPPAEADAKPDLTQANWGVYTEKYGFHDTIEYVSPFITYEDGSTAKFKVCMMGAYHPDEQAIGLFNAHKMEVDTMRAAAGHTVTSQMVKKVRMMEIPLMVDHIIKGWTNLRTEAPKTFTDADGREETKMVEVDVPYSKTACREFLTAIPQELWDDIRTYVSSDRFFLKRPLPSAADEKNLVGNSSD